MGYRSSKEFQMMDRLEKLSHNTGNPELDYNIECPIQIHQPTLKNKQLSEYLGGGYTSFQKIPNQCNQNLYSTKLGLVLSGHLDYRPS